MRAGAECGGGDPDTLLSTILQPQVRLGISTPKADPAGDYAWALFQKAEALQPGATARLETKALQLTGGGNSAQAPAGRNTYAWVMEQNRADVFLTYCTNAVAARAEVPSLQVVAVPEALQVGAAYGLTVRAGAPAQAQAFAQAVLQPRRRPCFVGWALLHPEARRVISWSVASAVPSCGAQRFFIGEAGLVASSIVVPPVAAAPDGTHQPKTAHHCPHEPEKAERWQAKQRGPSCTVMTMEEPMISAAITRAMASRLAERSIWSPTRLRWASSMPTCTRPRRALRSRRPRSSGRRSSVLSVCRTDRQARPPGRAAGSVPHHLLEQGQGF